MIGWAYVSERKRYLENKKITVLILFFILGSSMVSSMDSLSHTFKSIFFGIAMTVLIVIGIISLYQYFRSLKLK